MVNRCTPVLLTMIEKPGRYYLHVTVDDDALLPIQMVECRLTLKN